MVSSLLTTVTGQLPDSTPFDLSKANDDMLQTIKDVWVPPVATDQHIASIHHNELWISYPFEERYTGLGEGSRHPEIASEVKGHIDTHLNAIVDQASRFGVEELRSRWTLGELLTNATQYGAVSETDSSAGMIRVEWRLERDESGPTLGVAVANPCVNLFDPSRFARMEVADFYALEVTSMNGHVGTLGVLSYLKENTKLNYLWEMASGERIRLTMQEIPDNAPDRPANYEDLMKPCRVEVSKYDANNQPVPYSFEAFQRDIEQKVRAESVTVSCVVAGAASSNASESL